METHRILVVDDEVKMRRLLEMSLKNMGHEVVRPPTVRRPWPASTKRPSTW